MFEHIICKQIENKIIENIGFNIRQYNKDFSHRTFMFFYYVLGASQKPELYNRWKCIQSVPGLTGYNIEFENGTYLDAYIMMYYCLTEKSLSPKRLNAFELKCHRTYPFIISCMIE